MVWVATLWACSGDLPGWVELLIMVEPNLPEDPQTFLERGTELVVLMAVGSRNESNNNSNNHPLSFCPAVYAPITMRPYTDV